MRSQPVHRLCSRRVLVDALVEADLGDQRRGVGQQGGRDSSCASAKDHCEVAERDPEEENQHCERPRRDECLLDLPAELSTKRATKEESRDSTAVKRWDREEVQNCKIRGEEGGNLKEPAESESLSCSGNANGNSNRSRKRWALFGTAKWCTKEIGESADDCSSRFYGSLCRKANNINDWSFKRAGWEKVSDSDS